MFSQTVKPQTPVGPREAQRRATRAAVLEAARDEFERVGYDAANLRAIAARASVSAGTVLHHYADKRELLYAALFDDLEATLTRVLERVGSDPVELELSRITRGVLRYYERRPTLSRTLLKESLFADAPWSERFARQAATVHAAIVRSIEAAVTRGELRADTDGPLLALAYLSFFYFGLIAWVQGAQPKPAPMVDRLVEQHLRGLREEPRPKARGRKR